MPDLTHSCSKSSGSTRCGLACIWHSRSHPSGFSRKMHMLSMSLTRRSSEENGSSPKWSDHERGVSVPIVGSVRRLHRSPITRLR